MLGQFWHYSCDHTAEAIKRDGFLKPGADGFVWVTDLHPPIREALGLTSQILNCDRMAYEYQVADNDGIFSWMHARRDLPPKYVESLESAPGARPMHWFMSLGHVPIHLLMVSTGRPKNARMAGKTKAAPALRKQCDPGPSHDAQIKETS